MSSTTSSSSFVPPRARARSAMRVSISLPRFCLRNAGFREAFVTYARSLASAEATAALQELYSAGRAELRPCMPAHIRRWQNRVQVSAKQWDSAAARVGNFITKRPARFEQYLSRMLEVLDK